MRFFLPDHYSTKNAPKPTDRRVRIIDLPEQYFGVISYSGFASESNFEKHHEKLRMVLSNDGLVITGPPVKATYNSPFTPPFLRRNEAMYPLEWNWPNHLRRSPNLTRSDKYPSYRFSHIKTIQFQAWDCFTAYKSFWSTSGYKVYQRVSQKMWCGRGDSNSHGLRPTDFKSVMSTIPSRPHNQLASGDSAGNSMMQKESMGQG